MTGPSNIIQGIGNFFVHLINGNNFIAKLIHGPIDEIVAYEKTHGTEQLEAIVAVGTAKFAEERAAGRNVGDSIKAAVAAAFDAAIVDVKTLSTQAMTLLLAGATK